MAENPVWIPYQNRHVPNDSAESVTRSFADVMSKRRSVREFSDRSVSAETIENLVRVAASAPSGANKQPWRFVCVSDPAIKREIRLGAEEEERAFYASRASEGWLADLAPLGTDEHKAFLEIAPWLVVMFRLVRGDDEGQVYYSHESVGIAAGFFLAAAQHAGLATLTHTPSPMKFLGKILGRPDNERPFLLIPVGYPTEACMVPKVATTRKPLEDVMVRMNAET